MPKANIISSCTRPNDLLGRNGATGSPDNIYSPVEFKEVHKNGSCSDLKTKHTLISDYRCGVAELDNHGGDDHDLSDLLLIIEKLNSRCNRNMSYAEWNAYYSFPRLLISSDPNHDKRLDPLVLQPSLFHINHVPPTIYFDTKLSNDSRPPIGLPKCLNNYFKWKISSITPNSIRNCISFMKFVTIRPANNEDMFYLGSWCKHMLTPEFKTLDEWRKVNHYPGSFYLGRKDKLCTRLKLASEKFGSDLFGDFHPTTFILPKERDELTNYWNNSPSNLFIVKPPASARGNGVKVINNMSQIPEPVNQSNIIVQQYVSNPCLLENGQKFDLRLYVLLASVDPLRLYVYDEGLVRFASLKYTSQESGIVDQFMHLTNYYINKKNRDYRINNDCESLNGCKWTLSRFWRYLKEKYPHVDTTELWTRIKDIIVKTVVCCEGPIKRLTRKNAKNDYTSYELFGFDIILDADFKPYILEVNITPSLRSESDLDTGVKYNVIKDLFNLVGYNLIPESPASQQSLESTTGCRLFFDKRMYTQDSSKQGKIKQLKYVRQFKNDLDRHDLVVDREYISPCHDGILDNLTQEDIRVLMLCEDELSRSGGFKRVFPSPDSSKLLKYFDEPSYNDLLVDAWERKYRSNRIEGIKKLSSLGTFLDTELDQL